MTKARDLSQVPNASLGFKNRIINGDMRIDQRNAGASVTINGTTSFPVDRFKITAGGGGAITASRSTTAPTGFVNSLSNTVSTADASIAASDLYVIDYFNEGFNTADFGFGTANASTVTLSFWVRSSVTGTYGVRLCNGGSFNRSYVTTYVINSANTWEYKTVTIAGDTTGTWATDNSAGIVVSWDLGSGTDWNGTANTWQTGNKLRTSGCVNWISTLNATFQITGVQLEKGSTATSFDYRPDGTELALCQRYYWRLSATSGGPLLGFGAAATSSEFHAIGNYVVQMRSAPTFDFNSLNVSSASGGTFAVTANNGITATETTYRAVFGTGGGLTTNTHPYFLRANGTGWIAFSAEL